MSKQSSSGTETPKQTKKTIEYVHTKANRNGTQKAHVTLELDLTSHHETAFFSEAESCVYFFSIIKLPKDEWIGHARNVIL